MRGASSGASQRRQVLGQGGTGIARPVRQGDGLSKKLRLLWALYAIGRLNEKEELRLLEGPQEDVRGWAVRLLCDKPPVSEVAVQHLAALAQSEKSSWVRLALASALQRLPLNRRWALAEALAAHAEDAADANMPLMIWYGVEPLVPADPDRAVRLLGKARIPVVRQYIARRLTEISALVAIPWFGCWTSRTMPRFRHDVLTGMYEALQGRTGLSLPRGWTDVRGKLEKSATADVREKVLLLSVLFGDKDAIAELQATATRCQGR